MHEHPDQRDQWAKRLALLAAVAVTLTMLAIVVLFHPGDRRIMAICAISGIVSVAITTLAIRKASADYRRRWYEERAREARERKAEATDFYP